MLKIVLLVACSVAAVSCSDISEAMAYKLNYYNLLCHCWGEEAIDTYYAIQKEATKKCGGSIAADIEVEADTELVADTTEVVDINDEVASRKKRDLTKVQKKEFLVDVADYKSEMYSKLGNLTCVLKEMGLMTDEGKINIDHWSVESMSAKFSETPAGSEPGFLKKFSEEVNDCYEMAENYPKRVLNKSTFMKKFGKQHIFLACEKKVKASVCMKLQMKKYVEKSFGSVEILDGMDVYDSAAMEIRVMHEQATEEEQFIDQHFMGKSMY